MAREEVQRFADFYLSKSFTPLIQTREVGYIALTEDLILKVVGDIGPSSRW